MRRGPIALVALALVACRHPSPPAAPLRPPPVASLAAPAPPPPPPPLPHELAAPPVALTLIDSPTAQVFHIVDELSEWSPPVDAQYAEWAKKELPLDDGEQALLAKHALLRAKRRSGGIDATFDVSAPIAEAARAGIEKNVVTARDAAGEEALLEHFEPRLRPFLDAQAKTVALLEAQIVTELPRAAPVFARVGRFCEVAGTLPIRAVLVPSPSRGGGRASGTTIVLEVAAGEDPLPTFFHYLAHAILLPRRGTLAMAGRKCKERVDDQTLEDAIAYAIAPGLVPVGSARDRLRELADTERAGSLRDPRVRAVRLALAIRTDLGAALDAGDTMASFVPKMCDAWASVARP